MLQTEMNIFTKSAAELFQRIVGKLFYGIYILRQPRKGLLADLIKKIVFIFEVKIYRRCLIADFIGDFAHRNISEAVRDKHLAGGVHYFLPQIFLVAL